MHKNKKNLHTLRQMASKKFITHSRPLLNHLSFPSNDPSSCYCWKAPVQILVFRSSVPERQEEKLTFFHLYLSHQPEVDVCDAFTRRTTTEVDIVGERKKNEKSRWDNHGEQNVNRAIAMVQQMDRVDELIILLLLLSSKTLALKIK